MKISKYDLLEQIGEGGMGVVHKACDTEIGRTTKPKPRKNKILFINAVNEVTRGERAQSFLTDDHIERIVKAYQRFKDEPGFTRVATLEALTAWLENSKNVRKALGGLLRETHAELREKSA